MYYPAVVSFVLVAPLCSGDFRFALGISALLWGLPLCSGDNRFALGITALLWG